LKKILALFGTGHKDEISLLHAAFRRLVEVLTAKKILAIVLLSAF